MNRQKCREGCEPFPCLWEPGMSDNAQRLQVVDCYTQVRQAAPSGGFCPATPLGIERSTGPQFVTLDALFGASRVLLHTGTGKVYLDHGHSVLIENGKLEVSVHPGDRCSQVGLIFSSLPLHLHNPRWREISLTTGYVAVTPPAVPVASTKGSPIIITSTLTPVYVIGRADAAVPTEIRVYEFMDAGDGVPAVGTLLATTALAAGAIGTAYVNAPQKQLLVVLADIGAAGTGSLRVIGGFA